MDDKAQSLNELAREINNALVKVGRANWRRDFNTRLWACNREKALAVISDYRLRLAAVIQTREKDGASREFSALRS